jgi:hypothetical protein
MDWDEFYANLEQLKAIIIRAGGEIPQPSLHKVLEEMQHTRGKFHAANFDSTIPRPALIDVLHSRRGFGTSDARDRVFAHLGITAPLHSTMPELTIEVDYGKPVSETYLELTMKTMVASRNFEILRYAEHVSPASKNIDLPSWVPDWSLPIVHDPRLFSQAMQSEYWNLKYKLIHNGARVSKMMPEKFSKFLFDAGQPPMYNIWIQDPRVLTVECLQLGIVDNVSRAISDGDFVPNPNRNESISIGFENLVTIDRKAAARIYDAWRKKKGFEFLPSRPPQMTFGGTTIVEEGIYGANTPQPSQNSNTDDDVEYFEDFSDITLDIASQLLLHTCNPGVHRSLIGRSIALFRGDRSIHFGHFLGVVPATTQPGDLLCQLWPNILMIMRPLDIVGERFDGMFESTVGEYTMSANSTYRHPDLSFLAHVSCIGECISNKPFPNHFTDELSGPYRVLFIH